MKMIQSVNKTTELYLSPDETFSLIRILEVAKVKGTDDQKFAKNLCRWLKGE